MKTQIARAFRFAVLMPLAGCSGTPDAPRTDAEKVTASALDLSAVVSPSRPVNGRNFTTWFTLQGTGGNCLDVMGANPQSTVVDNGACNGTNAQKFSFNANGTITNLWGYCLDVLDDNTTAGSLDFTTCNGTAAQRWQLHGSQVIGPAGKCLDVLGNNPTPGQTVDLATCNGTTAQVWQVIDAPTILRGVGTECLDIVNSNTSPGAPLQIFGCNRGPNSQIFTFTAAGQVQNAVGECLTVANETSGTVQMTTCNGSSAQRWTRQGRELRSGVSSNSVTGMCLSTVVESGRDHTVVGLAPCNGLEDQQWIPADLFPYGQAQLLVVTSNALESAFSSFLSFKASIGVSAKLLDLSTIRASYPASDDALSVKLAIKDYYENEGTEYVLLGGDATQVPVRFRTVTDVAKNNRSFIFSDLYYANLYTGHLSGNGFHGGFDNWDSNGNGLFDEQPWDTPLLNPDNVNGFPDVAVARIPAPDAATMTGTLAKIITYEKELPAHGGSGMPFAGKFGFAGDADYSGNGEAYADVEGAANRLGVSLYGYAEEIGLTARATGKPGPQPTGLGWVNDDDSWTQFNAAMQASSFEWVTYIGHGGPNAWGYYGGYSNQVSALTNAYWPFVAGAACQTAAMTPQIGGIGYPIGSISPPGPYGSSSAGTIGAMWLTNPSGGAIAYVGENIVLEDQPGVDFVVGLYQEKNAGYTRVGDMWRLRQQAYFAAEYDKPGYDPEFSAPWIYLGIINIFGDPSMQVL